MQPAHFDVSITEIATINVGWDMKSLTKRSRAKTAVRKPVPPLNLGHQPTQEALLSCQTKVENIVESLVPRYPYMVVTVALARNLGYRLRQLIHGKLCTRKVARDTIQHVDAIAFMSRKTILADLKEIRAKMNYKEKGDAARKSRRTRDRPSKLRLAVRGGKSNAYGHAR